MREQDQKLFDAIGNQDLQAVTEAIRLGADVTVKDKLGFTPLHKAAERENLQVVEALIQGGAKVNAKDEVVGATPLHKAAEIVNRELMVALIKAGADVNATDLRGDTPWDTMRKVLQRVATVAGFASRVDEQRKDGPPSRG